MVAQTTSCLAAHFVSARTLSTWLIALCKCASHQQLYEWGKIYKGEKKRAHTCTHTIQKEVFLKITTKPLHSTSHTAERINKFLCCCDYKSCSLSRAENMRAQIQNVWWAHHYSTHLDGKAVRARAPSQAAKLTKIATDFYWTYISLSEGAQVS